MQASVKDNILFSKPYQHEKYKKVLEACALIDDLKLLPAGDQTELGENVRIIRNSKIKYTNTYVHTHTHTHIFCAQMCVDHMMKI